MATADRKVIFRQRDGRNVAIKGFSLYQADDALVNELAEYLGCSRSEVVRTAVRAFAARMLPYNDPLEETLVIPE